MKKILIIGTGGTIASADGPNGLTPSYEVDRLLEFIPEATKMCHIVTMQLLNIDSSNIQPDDWMAIVNVITENFSKYDGFVILHGTDTMAYTASVLCYMIQNSSKPIVLTGSQKPIAEKRTDVKNNIADSIRFACQNTGGIFIVFRGRAINGCRAVKIRTKSFNAFESVNFPIAAYIKKGNVIFNPQYPFRKIAGEPYYYSTIEKNVILIKLIPGLNSNILNFIKGNYKGIVIESFGSGGVPFLGENNFLSKIEELAASGVITVITTQCLFEGSNLNIYEVGRNTMMSRIIPAYDMTTEAAITKLMWALGQASDFDRVKELFLTPVQNDISIHAYEDKSAAKTKTREEYCNGFHPFAR